MTKKAVERLWVNPRAMKKRVMPCYNDMLQLMSCFKKSNFEDTKCATEIKALNECMALQAKAPKEVNTINHHLQRLARGGSR